jgi:hypothetical protein
MEPKLTIVSATNLYRQEDDFTEVFMKVWFEEIDHPLQFTATSFDCTMHGRELWFRAMKGEYGPIEVIPPIAHIVMPEQPVRLLTYDRPS